MSVNNPFGKKGVPKSADALRVLRVDVGKKVDEHKKSSGQGFEEIVLTDTEQESLKQLDIETTRKQLREWVNTFSDDDYYDDEWFERHFVIHQDGSWDVIGNQLDLSYSDVAYLPSDLNVLDLNITDTNITEIPSRCNIQIIELAQTSIQTLPVDTGALQKIIVDPDEDHRPIVAVARARGIAVSYTG